MHGRVLAALCALLVFPAGASAASYELRASGDRVELLRDGAQVDSRAAGADWTITAADGVGDTLTVRNPDGGVLPARVRFDGGDGEGVDALHVIGGRSDSGESTAAGPDSGTITHRRGSDELFIAYDGLEPVVDTVPEVNAVYTYGAGDDQITVDDGTTTGDGRLRVDTPTSEEVEFANKVNVTIDGGDGNDAISVDNTETAAGLTGTMTIDTNAMGSIGVAAANYSGATLRLVAGGGVGDANGDANNVTADALDIDAGTGILLETTVSGLEAETAEGAIDIANTGNVTVGGISSGAGLRVGANGSIFFSTSGSMTLNDADGTATVVGGATSGSVSLMAGSTFATTAGVDAVRAPAGSIGITATAFEIGAGSEIVGAFMVAFVKSGSNHNLGLTSGDLSDAELDEVTAPSLDLVAAAIAVRANVTLDPARVPQLNLEATSGDISDTGGALTVQGLDLRALSGQAGIDEPGTTVGTLTGTAALLAFTNSGALTIGTSPSVGVRSTSEDLLLTTGGNLTVNGRIDSAASVGAGSTTAGALIDNNARISGTSVRLFAGRMTLADGTIDAGTGAATLEGVGSQTIDLGSTTDAGVGILELSDAEFDTITAGNIVVGRVDGGSIAVTAPITLGTDLALLSGSLIVDAGPGSLTLPKLRASAGGSIALNGANDVDTLAALAGTSLTYADTDALTVGTVLGQNGVATTDGDVSMTTGGNLAVEQLLKAGGSRLMTLNVGGTAADSGDGRVSAERLELLGGHYQFASASNAFETVAADATSVLLTDGSSLTVGTAGATEGVTSDAFVSIFSLGNLTFDRPVTGAALNLLTAAGTLDNNVTLSGTSALLGSAKMTLGDGTVDVGAGQVKIFASSSSRTVNLGSATDSGSALELSDAELDTITAGNVLVGPDFTGSITFTGAITPAGFDELALTTEGAGATIEDNHGGFDVTVDKLTLDAPAGIGAADVIDTRVSDLQIESDSGNVNVFNDAALSLGMQKTGSGRTRLVNEGDLTVARALSSAGAVSLQASGTNATLTNSAPVTAAGVELAADRMALGGGTIDSGSEATTLANTSFAWPIDLGATADPAGSLSLSDAELDTVTAGKLAIGVGDSGQLTVSQAIAPANAPSLALTSGGDFAGPGVLTAADLALTDGSSAGRTWTVDKGAVSNGGPPIPYTGVETLTVNGGPNGDAFNVKASPTTRITVAGGDPAGEPGDAFSYDSEGRSYGGDLSLPDGNVTSSGVQDVVFTGIEIASFDVDADGAPDPSDNCVNVANPGQADQDSDSIGDACDEDRDGDGLAQAADNCPAVANADQTDRDGDGIGRACDPVELLAGDCENPLPGTPGPDALDGTEAGDRINGGAGDDVVHGRLGDDCATGDDGDDTLFGETGADRLRGGDGDDRVAGGAGDDRYMRGGDGRDGLSGGTGRDGMAGGAGPDRLSGGSGADYLSGGRGDDRLAGGTGRNRYFGRSGDDRIRAANGVRETVSCGTGDDVAVVDLRDRVLGCERVLRSG